jgi:anti-sigma factor RsiW
MGSAAFRWNSSPRYLNGELDPNRRLDLEAHLTTCAACKSAEAKEVKFRSLIRAHLWRDEQPPQLRPRIEEFLKKLACLE